MDNGRRSLGSACDVSCDLVPRKRRKTLSVLVSEERSVHAIPSPATCLAIQIAVEL